MLRVGSGREEELPDGAPGSTHPPNPKCSPSQGPSENGGGLSLHYMPKRPDGWGKVCQSMGLHCTVWFLQELPPIAPWCLHYPQCCAARTLGKSLILVICMKRKLKVFPNAKDFSSPSHRLPVPKHCHSQRDPADHDRKILPLNKCLVSYTSALPAREENRSGGPLRKFWSGCLDEETCRYRGICQWVILTHHWRRKAKLIGRATFIHLSASCTTDQPRTWYKDPCCINLRGPLRLASFLCGHL